MDTTRARSPQMSSGKIVRREQRALWHGARVNTGTSEKPIFRHAPPWESIKTAYLNGEGSLRVLAERFGISENTLEKRAARERWRSQHFALCGKVAETAEQTAEKRGMEIGERAAAFVARTLDMSGDFLDRIKSELDAASRGDPYAVRCLVQGWKDVVATTRTAYNLDQRGRERVRINVLTGVGHVQVIADADGAETEPEQENLESIGQR
jgi:hypothetical protein